MTNNAIRSTVATMLDDWNAMSFAEQKRASLTASIAASYAELRHRGRAALYLKGIPKQQNATAIERLYDKIVTMHIELLEVK